MFCNKCGSELAEDAKFCRQCGEPTPMARENNIIPNQPAVTEPVRTIGTEIAMRILVLVLITSALALSMFIKLFSVRPLASVSFLEQKFSVDDMLKQRSGFPEPINSIIQTINNKNVPNENIGIEFTCYMSLFIMFLGIFFLFIYRLNAFWIIALSSSIFSIITMILEYVTFTGYFGEYLTISPLHIAMLGIEIFGFGFIIWNIFQFEKFRKAHNWLTRKEKRLAKEKKL